MTPLKRVSVVVMDICAVEVEVSATSGFPIKLVRTLVCVLAGARTSIEKGEVVGICAVGTADRGEPVWIFSPPPGVALG